MNLGRVREGLGLMKVAGEATARGSAEAVWGALHDAAVLARAMPGCEHFEVTGPGLAEFVATTALPAIGGTYAGKLTIAEQQRPSLLRLSASATGDQGTIAADVTLRLSESAGAATTVVSYEANGTVAGSVAAVGTRLLASAAKRLASEFFAVIDESVTANAATPAAAASAAAVSATVEPAAAEPERAGGDAGRPPASARPGPLADNRAALVAGAAIGLAGIVIGVLAGRRGGRAGRERT